MKVTACYINDEVEIDVNFLHIKFELDSGKTFKVAANDNTNVLYLYCDSQLVVYPETANRVHFDMEVY